MHNRKFQSDFLFNGSRFLEPNQILITDNKGIVLDIVNEMDAGDNVEKLNGLISPGFINAHCHLELSHLKNKIPEKEGLIDFVFKVVSQRKSSELEIIHSIEKAENEMLQNGIVAVGDICNNGSTIDQKKKKNLAYYNFIETSGWLPEIADSRFEFNWQLKNEYEQFSSNNSIVPHAPYSVSEPLWEKLATNFKGKTITIHNQENIDEDELFLEGKGQFVEMFRLMKIDNSFFKKKNKRSPEFYFHFLKDAASIILVHNTFTQQKDLDLMLQQKSKEQLLSFCLCPNANLYIENTLPPVELLLENDCQIVLGTDSLASNHQLSILEEIKTIAQNFPNISIEKMLTWATLNGARSLQMDNQLGSFERGKQPGVICIENFNESGFQEDAQVSVLL